MQTICSFYRLDCLPQHLYVDVFTPVAQNMTVLGDGAFKEVIWVGPYSI